MAGGEELGRNERTPGQAWTDGGFDQCQQPCRVVLPAGVRGGGLWIIVSKWSGILAGMTLFETARGHSSLAKLRYTGGTGTAAVYDKWGK